MAVQKQDNQHEHTFSSYVRLRGVVLKTCLGLWTIGREWRERVRDIRVTSATWWWWWFHEKLWNCINFIKKTLNSNHLEPTKKLTILSILLVSEEFGRYMDKVFLSKMTYHQSNNRSSPINPTPPLGQDMTLGQFFKWSLAGLNSEFFLLLD